MTNRVLVAVDGTEASRAALEIACTLAETYEANLGLVCVIEPDQVSDELIKGAMVEGVLKRPDYVALYRDTLHSREGFTVSKDAQRASYVARLATEIADHIVNEAEAYSKDSAAKAVKTFVCSGDPADEILRVAKDNDADYIVMGHDQKGLLESLIKGSVAQKVVREAACPCLVYCQPK